MKSLTRCFVTIALSLGVFSAMVPSAMASSAVFVFNDPNQLISGTITYNPITTEVTGSNISITQVHEGSGPFLPGSDDQVVQRQRVFGLQVWSEGRKLLAHGRGS